MAIAPVKPGGWARYGVLRSSEFAQIDERLSTFGLDAIAADTVTGKLSFQQDPTHAGIHPTITINGGGFLELQAANARIRTANGGRFVLGDGDVPTYSATRSRRVKIPLIDAGMSSSFGGSHGNQALVHRPSGGLTSASSYAQFPLSLPKPQDGATIADITVYFFFTDPTIVGANVGLQIATWPTSGVQSLVIIGGASATYNYAGGAVQTLFVNAFSSPIVLALATQRVAMLLQPDFADKWVGTAYEVHYTGVAGEGFSQ